MQGFKSYIEVLFPGRLFRLVDRYLPRVARSLPEPYYSELRGISSVTDIPLGEITLYNIFYELFSACTSLIAQEAADGHVYHARNLDFGLFLGYFDDVIIASQIV